MSASKAVSVPRAAAHSAAGREARTVPAAHGGTPSECLAAEPPIEATSERLGVALVASSLLVRAGLQRALEAELEVLLDADTLAAARELGWGGARVAIAETSLPVDAGVTPPLVLLVPASTPPQRIGAALAAGHSVLPARASAERVVAAARAAAVGLVSSVAAAVPPDAPEPLTPREQRVLALMIDGLSNPRIAQALQISPHTAKYHVGQIIAKLGASSRAHAVALALSHWA